MIFSVQILQSTAIIQQVYSTAPNLYKVSLKCVPFFFYKHIFCVRNKQAGQTTNQSGLQKESLSFVRMYIFLMVFSFLPKNVHFISKNAISCLFLKNISPSKRMICFILNNLHFSMVEGIAFYALHKSRVLIIPCKADGFCLFIGLPDEI